MQHGNVNKWTWRKVYLEQLHYAYRDRNCDKYSNVYSDGHTFAYADEHAYGVANGDTVPTCRVRL